MTRIRRTYVDGPFGQIHVRVADAAASTRRPLLCLHQSPKSGLEFEAFMRHLAPGRASAAPDYPGYGMSDPPLDQAHATIPAYAHSMLRVVNELGWGAVDLFGNHTGAMVAAEMAATAPSRVGVIVMVSAAILTEAERAAFDAYFQPVALDAAGTRFAGMWDRIRTHAGPGMTLEMMARSYLQNQMGGEGYEWGHAAAFAHAPRFSETLAALRHRIAVINPADDLQIQTRRAAPLLRHGAVLERPDWGNGFLDAFPADVADLVRTILDEAD